jgi:hypothetical protein
MKQIVIIIALLANSMASDAQAVIYNNGSILQVSAGCIVQVNGNFINKAASTFTNNGMMAVTGNSTNDQVMATPNAGTLEFNGTSVQTLNGTATYFAKNILVNNAAGLTLNAALKVDGVATFTNGIVTATATNTALIFTGNGSATGTNDASHVNGYVVKEGIGSFTYPVGDGSKYQKCDVNLSANATGIQVKYNATDAAAGVFTTGGTESTALVSYNTQEYWDITALSTAVGKVTIYWDGYKDSYSNAVTQRKVGHKTGGNWLNEGTTGTGTVVTGSVVSNTVNSWSPFALASILSILPLQWLDVNGYLNSNKQSVINFRVNETNVARYEIEKSNNGRNFINIGIISSKGNGENQYQFTENAALDGIKYYRIKQIDLDNRYSYSSIIKLADQKENSITVFPNPARDVFTISGAKIGSKGQLSDLSGKVLQTITIRATSFNVDISKYNNGMYVLKMDNGSMQKVIKQ